MNTVESTKIAGNREESLSRQFWQLVARNDCDGVKAFMADKSDEERQDLVKSRPHDTVLMSEVRGPAMEKLLSRLGTDDCLDDEPTHVASAYYEWAYYGVHYSAHAGAM